MRMPSSGMSSCLSGSIQLWQTHGKTEHMHMHMPIRIAIAKYCCFTAFASFSDKYGVIITIRHRRVKREFSKIFVPQYN